MWTTRRAKKPPENQITTLNSEEFDAAIQREKNGEFRIVAMERGKTNGVWVLEISRPRANQKEFL